MQRIKKKALAVWMMCVMLLAACSGKEAAPSNTPQGEPPAGQKQITIDYWTIPVFKNVEGAPGQNFGDWEQYMLEQFRKDHPNVKINFQMIPINEVEQKVTIALAGNNPPDILLDGLDKRLSKYIQFDKSEPIDDFLENDKEDYIESYLKPFYYNGKLYGVPMSINAEYFFLNKTIFKNKGLEHLIPEDRDWTIEEWRDAMRQVSGDGVYGTALFAGSEQSDEMNLLYLLGNGAEQWNEASTQVTLDQYPEASEMLQIFNEMVAEGSIATGPASLKNTDMLELFKQGKLAMIPWAQSLYGIVADGQQDGSVVKDLELYGMKPVHKESVVPQVALSYTGYTVFKQNDPEKREMIKKLIQFITTSENMKKLGQAVTRIPPRISSAYVTEDPDMAAMNEIVTTLPMANLGMSNPMYSDIRVLWYPSFQAALLGKLTPQQALEDYARKANEVLKMEQK